MNEFVALFLRCFRFVAYFLGCLEKRILNNLSLVLNFQCKGFRRRTEREPKTSVWIDKLFWKFG